MEKDEDTEIYQVVAESGILANSLPPYLSEFITEKYKTTLPASVKILTDSKISSIKTENQQASINFENQPDSNLTVDQAGFPFFLIFLNLNLNVKKKF